jgi:hypothetical protein
MSTYLWKMLKISKKITDFKKKLWTKNPGPSTAAKKANFRLLQKLMVSNRR